MQETQLRMGIVMVLALLAVSLVLRFWEPEEDRVDTAETHEVWKVVHEDVTGVAIDRAKGPLTLVKTDTGWAIEEPFRSLADEWKTKELLRTLTDIERGVPLGEVDDPARYGLGDPPRATATLTLAGGKTAAIRIGSDAPGGQRFYVQVGDGPISAVSGGARAFDEDPIEFRDRRILRFEIPDVTRVEIAGPNGTLGVAKTGQRWWVDGFTRADERRVEDLMLDLLDLRFDNIAPDGLVPVTDGEFDVTVTLADGSRLGMHVSEPEAGPGSPVLVSAEGGMTGGLDSKALAFLGQGPVDVGDASAFPVDATAALRVEIVFGEASLIADKAGDAWNVEGKPTTRVEAAFTALADASIHYRRDPVAAITAPYGTIRVKTGAGEVGFDVGEVVDASFRVVQDHAGGQPYLVPIDQIEAVIRAITSASG